MSRGKGQSRGEVGRGGEGPGGAGGSEQLKEWLGPPGLSSRAVMTRAALVLFFLALFLTVSVQTNSAAQILLGSHLEVGCMAVVPPDGPPRGAGIQCPSVLSPPHPCLGWLPVLPSYSGQPPPAALGTAHASRSSVAQPQGRGVAAHSASRWRAGTSCQPPVMGGSGRVSPPCPALPLGGWRWAAPTRIPATSWVYAEGPPVGACPWPPATAWQADSPGLPLSGRTGPICGTTTWSVPVWACAFCLGCAPDQS